MTQPEHEPHGAEGSPVARAVSELLGGLRVVDQGLELDSGVRVDWVSVDRSGDLVLLMPVSGRGASSLASVLDLCAFATTHGDVLRRAYDCSPEARLRLVVVAELFEEDVLRRLSVLDGVELVRLNALRSQRGERVFALPVGPAPAPVAVSPPPPRPPVTDDIEALLAPLSEETASNVRAVLRRLERLDDSLSVRTLRDGLAWYQGDEMLARVELHSDGDAVGVVPGRASRPLGGRQGVDLFLDEAVAAFVDKVAGDVLADADMDVDVTDGEA